MTQVHRCGALEISEISVAYIGWPCTKRVLHAALTHDITEFRTSRLDEI